MLWLWFSISISEAKILENVWGFDFPLSMNATAAVLNHYQKHNISFHFRTRFHGKLSNFISVETYSKESHVTDIPGALRFYPIRQRSHPLQHLQLQQAKPNQQKMHDMTGVNEARRKLGLTGKGVVIAVLDSGVYYIHPALGGGFGPGFKIIGGHDFVGDEYGLANKTPVPDDDPFDNCSSESHGTHIAGIIAADATNISAPGFVPDESFEGVAPDASILAYRIFGCASDFTATDVITTAIYAAANDGANIINLSIGGGPGYADEPDAIAAAIVSEAGHFVVAANGNDGISGPYVGSDPGVSRGAFGVASFDNSYSLYCALDFGGRQFPFIFGQLSEELADGTELQIVVNDIMAQESNILDDGCQINPNLLVSGKALLIRWGLSPNGCSSTKRCETALQQGAIACIIYNNEGMIPGLVGSKNIVSLGTSNDGGKAIIEMAKLGDVRALVRTRKVEFSIETSGTVSDFSSPGLDNDLFMKPDFGAIGGQVYSTISAFAATKKSIPNAYNTQSGSSMAAPYAAGALALLIQQRGLGMSFSEAKVYLQNTATVTNLHNSEMIHSPAYQGAGLINIFKAATTKTFISPSAISLNDTVNKKPQESITISNYNLNSVIYELDVVFAATVNCFANNDDIFLDRNSTTFSDNYPRIIFLDSQRGSTNISISSNQSSTVTFEVIPPVDTFLWPTYGGYIRVKNTLDGSISVVPFVGVAGSWNSRPMWMRTSNLMYNKWATTTIAQLIQSNSQSFAPASISTGVYIGSQFEPITPNITLNLSSPVYILSIAASTSRYSDISVISLSSVIDAPFLGLIDLSNPAGPQTSLISTKMPRNTFLEGSSVYTPTVYQWDGTLFDTNGNSKKISPGSYRIRFTAMKNFGGGSDVIETEDLNVIY